jgi:hypothetical protein
MFRRNFGMPCCQMNPCCGEPQNCPIVEPAINKCIEREVCHEVKHVCPIHTHIINRHIYNHTYTPQYTCDEETQVVNNDQGGCCKFMNNGL